MLGARRSEHRQQDPAVRSLQLARQLQQQSSGRFRSQGITQPRVNQNTLVLLHAHAEPKLFNDFRIGYHRIDFDTLNHFSVNGIHGAGADLGIPGSTATSSTTTRACRASTSATSAGSARGGTNWYQFDTTFQMSNVLAYNRGSHNVRAGFDLRRLATGRRAANDPRGRFDFTGDITGYSVADFMLGLPRTVITPTDQIQGHVGGWRNGFFVNDVWQASRNLTLSLGLRYEMNTPVQTYAGYATMLAEDFETIIPERRFPSKGFKFHRAEQERHRSPAGRDVSPWREDRGARRVRNLLQPEPDELVHVPDQQPAAGCGVDVHVGSRQPDAVVRQPDGRGRRRWSPT